MNRTFVHITPRENVAAIMRDGLVVDAWKRHMEGSVLWGSSVGMSGGLRRVYRDAYGGRWPIFLASPDHDIDYLDARVQSGDYAKLWVTLPARGYRLYPDLPTIQTEVMDYLDLDLRDASGYAAECEAFLALRDEAKPLPNRLAKVLVTWSQTVAVLRDIPASCITRRNPAGRLRRTP